MEKQRQRELQKWLKSQQKVIKKYMHLNILLGSFSSLCMIGQMWLIATMLDKMLIGKQSPNSFLVEIMLLFCCFAARAFF
ncbi:TPA: cysteine/glutathione ABC transporter permease/ATP-binding protein CydD, partial [Mannheimia haemolytica]|nr:cysteine/glutathione ABC transporter permease/ATP-binding protein CydD [Mannheimia haemolytica]